MLSNRRSMLGPSMGDKRATWNKRSSSFALASTLAGTINEGETARSILTNPDAEPHCKTTSVLTSTTSELPSYRTVKVIGAVYGTTTCALPKDGKSLMKNARTGAEVKVLTHIIYNAREQATERMMVDCVSRGGNAIVGMSFGEGEIAGCAHVSVNGTAVYVEPA